MLMEEPISFTDAMNSKQSKNWLEAMNDEMNSLIKNNTWTLVKKPPNQKLVGCKWLYKLKETVNQEEPYWYKARLVTKGFTQREGVDYDEIFSHVVRHTSIRILMSLTVAFNLKLEQLDVKTVFMHGELMKPYTCTSHQAL